MFCLHVGNDGAIWWKRSWLTPSKVRSSGMTGVPFNNISRQETRIWCFSPLPHPIDSQVARTVKPVGKVNYLVNLHDKRKSRRVLHVNTLKECYSLQSDEGSITKFSYEEIVKTIGGKS